MKHWLQNLWWRPEPPPLLLRPLAALYGAVADARAARQQAQSTQLPVPVIVVGNIAVGGTGKTPVALWLLEQLRAMGQQPALISRGYGGAGPFPLLVRAGTAPEACGDEPLLIAQRSGLPVCVAPSRVAAGRALLAAHPQTTVLVCDDGLQHYALARQLELGVVDATRGHGNGWRLPAGPLRELPARLARCALVLVNGGPAAAYGPQALRFDLVADSATGERRALSQFAGQTVHAVAGIGNPARFFATLQATSIVVNPQPFADHHAFSASDLAFGDQAPVLMTEKDAVKCQPFATRQHWAVPVQLAMSEADTQRVRQCLVSHLQTSAQTSSPLPV